MNSSLLASLSEETNRVVRSQSEKIDTDSQQVQGKVHSQSKELWGLIVSEGEKSTKEVREVEAIAKGVAVKVEEGIDK